jgi:phosphotransferase system enzyme I (PtsP)
MQLLCDIGELSWIFNDSRDLKTFLQKIVIMVANHMRAEVCSIYLYNEEAGELVLTATKGLNPDYVGLVKLGKGEGLTGLALEELRPIAERTARLHPKFKRFEGLDEERYESFLGVPILRGPTGIGVLVIQRQREEEFEKDDIQALQAVASQLANIIENTKLLMRLNDQRETGGSTSAPFRGETYYQGRVASEGFALGRAVVSDRGKTLATLSQLPLERTFTLEDMGQAIERTQAELEELQKQVEEKLSDVASLIFSAHLLMLKDDGFVGQIYELIGQGESPPRAVVHVAEKYILIFSQSANTYLREKVQDVEDLAVRLIGHLLSEEERPLGCRDAIVVAQNLFPSDILRLATEGVKGIVLVSGGVTSHLSILARSLQIPMVIVDNPDLLLIPKGTKLLLDAESGEVFFDPSREIETGFRSREKSRRDALASRGTGDGVCFTRDGTRVRLLANVNLLTDLSLAASLGAEGVGLYRSEFPFMIRSDFPSEEEQFYVYRKVVEGMPEKPVTLRTLDIGGDKVLTYYPNMMEQNPFMGMRSIRFSLQHQDIFKKQVRAMLRAGNGADLTVLFPMISSLDEFLDARDTVRACIQELKAEGAAFNATPKIGLMVEIPSVLDIIDDLAKEADAFSLGTNDLIQYMLAVDRTNEKVAALYMPHHPAILRAIRTVVAAAHRHGKDVSICGDMAHNEQYLPFLLGVGLRSLSVDPVELPKMRKAIAEIDLGEAKDFAETLLAQSRARDIANLLEIPNARPLPSTSPAPNPSESRIGI